jgi:4a-hydroxytetrahydrobiopterin dehydratase
MHDGITPTQFQQSDGVGDWRVLSDGVTAFYPTGSFAESVRFAAAIAELEAVAGHPPDVDIRRGGVTVRLLTAGAEWYGPSRRDLEVARAVSGIARSLKLEADLSAVQSLLVIPGAPEGTDIMPFWQAVLGYDRRPDSPDEDLVDPSDRGPAFWFESMREARGDGGGAIHIAVWVPEEHAEARVAAALAAGGRLVRDQFAPTWWTLADAAGNEADISTMHGRD